MKLLEAPPSSAVSALLQGLIKPSLLSLIITCITVLTVTGAFLNFSKPSFIAHRAELLAAYNDDDDIYITSTVLKLQLENSTPPSIYMVGDSALREVILEDDLALQLRKSQKNYRIVELLSGRQTLLESMAIIDNINEDANGVIILGVSPKGLTFSESEYISAASGKRRGFTSAALAEFLTAKGQTSYRITNIHGLDNINFLLPRYLKHVLTGNKKKIRRVTHHFKDEDPMSPDTVAISAKRYLNDIFQSDKKYDFNASAGIAALNTIIETIDGNEQLQLLLIEKPLNPYFTDTYPGQDLINQYQSLIEEFSHLNKVNYLDPTDSFEYNPLDFADLVHVTGGTTSNRYTSLVAQTILNNYE